MSRRKLGAGALTTEVIPADDALPDPRLALIAVARAEFNALFGAVAEFGATRWPIGHLKVRSPTGTGANLHFVEWAPLHTHEAPDRSSGADNLMRVAGKVSVVSKSPLVPYFADVVRAWLILAWDTPGSAMMRLAAVRVLYAVMAARRGGIAQFRWATLSTEDLAESERRMALSWSTSTTYKMAGKLASFAEFLAARGICSLKRYRVQTPRPESLDRYTLDGQEARLAKLPTDAAIQGLAQIHARLAVTGPDRLLIAAVAILAVTGFRIGELLTLPLDCEIADRVDGVDRYGIRYYREKDRAGPFGLDVRWLSATQAELARHAIAEIRALTADARRRAAVLERADRARPGSVPLPPYARDVEWLTCDDVVALVGLDSRGSLYAISTTYLPRHGEPGMFAYRSEDLARYLATIRVARLWTLDRRDGSFQALSESLFVVFRNFLARCRGTNPLLVAPVRAQQLTDFVGGRCGANGVDSAFVRFNLIEPDGRPCRITSHQLRHWLNTIAARGGLPRDVLTRWMGRSYAPDTEAYLHLTVDERLEWARDAVRRGAVAGPVADAYVRIADEVRDVFLEGQLQSVHVTPFGLCVHDFAVTPCPFHLNCLRGCRDYLRTLGSARERAALVQLRRRTAAALDAAEAAVGEGVSVAAAWVESHREIILHVDRALAVDDPDAPDHDPVRGPADQRSGTYPRAAEERSHGA